MISGAQIRNADDPGGEVIVYYLAGNPSVTVMRVDELGIHVQHVMASDHELDELIGALCSARGNLHAIQSRKGAT